MRRRGLFASLSSFGHGSYLRLESTGINVECDLAEKLHRIWEGKDILTKIKDQYGHLERE